MTHRRLIAGLVLVTLASVLVWAGMRLLNSGDKSSSGATAILRPTDPQTVRAITANIRYASPSDKGELWNDRRAFLIQTILKREPDLVGFQEVTPTQLAYVVREMPAYEFLPSAGAAPQDLLTTVADAIGNMNQLAYRKGRFTLVEQAHGLLRPKAMQADPKENAYYTLGVLSDRSGTMGELIVVNTHLRHGVANATASAGRLHEILRGQLAKHPTATVVVTGDMNHDRTTPVYAALIGTADDPTVMRDTFDYHACPAGALWGTWHDFTGKSTQPWPTDLIFVSPQAAAEPAAMIRDQEPNTGRWPTDHFLVWTTLHKK